MESILIKTRIQGAIGSLLILASFFSLLAPFTLTPLALAHLCFLVGSILLFDAVSQNFGGPHLKLNHIPRLVLTGFIVTLFTELYIHWWGKFWFYTYLSPGSYLVIGIPLLCIYMIYLLTAYWGTLSVIRSALEMKPPKAHIPKSLEILMPTIGRVSAIVAGISTAILAFGFTKPSADQFFSIHYAPSNSPLLFPVIAIAALSLCALFEYLTYELRGRSPILGPIMSGDYVPLIAILVAGWVSGLVYEGFNAPSGWWRYTNIPFSGIRLFDVPLLVFILWPLQYVPIISLYSLLRINRTK